MWVVLKLRSLDGEAGSSLDLSLDLEQTEEPPAQALRLQTFLLCSSGPDPDKLRKSSAK